MVYWRGNTKSRRKLQEGVKEAAEKKSTLKHLNVT